MPETLIFESVPRDRIFMVVPRSGGHPFSECPLLRRPPVRDARKEVSQFCLQTALPRWPMAVYLFVPLRHPVSHYTILSAYCFGFFLVFCRRWSRHIRQEVAVRLDTSVFCKVPTGICLRYRGVEYNNGMATDGPGHV